MILTNLTSQHFIVFINGAEYKISPGENNTVEGLENNFFVKLMIAQRNFILEEVQEDMAMTPQKKPRSSKSK